MAVGDVWRAPVGHMPLGRSRCRRNQRLVRRETLRFELACGLVAEGFELGHGVLELFLLLGEDVELAVGELDPGAGLGLGAFMFVDEQPLPDPVSLYTSPSPRDS